MSWEIIGKLVAYLAFFHAIAAFAWAFFLQANMVFLLMHHTAVERASGNNMLEAQCLALFQVFSSPQHTALRRRWAKAVIWVVCAFGLALASAPWLAPQGIK
ncbi:MAG: hypothetical protein AB3N17_14470 [Tateyamaria sp.]